MLRLGRFITFTPIFASSVQYVTVKSWGGIAIARSVSYNPTKSHMSGRFGGGSTRGLVSVLRRRWLSDVNPYRSSGYLQMGKYTPEKISEQIQGLQPYPCTGPSVLWRCSWCREYTTNDVDRYMDHITSKCPVLFGIKFKRNKKGGLRT